MRREPAHKITQRSKEYQPACDDNYPTYRVLNSWVETLWHAVKEHYDI